MFKRDQIWARMTRGADEPLRLSPRLPIGTAGRSGHPTGWDPAAVWRSRVKKPQTGSPRRG